MHKITILQITLRVFVIAGNTNRRDCQTYAVAPTSGPLMVKGPPVDKIVDPWLRVGFVVETLIKGRSFRNVSHAHRAKPATRARRQQI